MLPYADSCSDKGVLCAVRKVLASYRGCCGGVAGREATSCGAVQKILHSNLGDLRNGKLALGTFWPGDDVSNSKARRCAGNIRRLAICLRLHGCKRGNEILVEAQVAQMRQLKVIESVRPEAGRVSRCRKRSVVGRGARGVMRECRRRGSSRHGRAWSGPLCHPVRIRVVILVRMRPRHWLRGVGILGKARKAVVAVRMIPVAGGVVAARVRVMPVAVLKPRSSVRKQVHVSRQAIGTAVAAQASVAVCGQVVADVRGVVRERVRRRHIW